MKIKKEILKKIIAEEKQKLLSEGVMGSVGKKVAAVGGAAALAAGAVAGGGALKQTAEENAKRIAEIDRVLRTSTPLGAKREIIEKVTHEPFNDAFAVKYKINIATFMNGVIMSLAEEGKVKLVNNKIVPTEEKPAAGQPAPEAKPMVGPPAPMKESMSSLMDRIVNEELAKLKKKV